MATYKTFIHKTDFTEVLVVDIPGEGMFLTDSPGEITLFEPSESWIQETEFEIRGNEGVKEERHVSTLAPMSGVTGRENPSNYGSGHVSAIRNYLTKHVAAALGDVPQTDEICEARRLNKALNDRITDLLRRAGIVEKTAS